MRRRRSRKRAIGTRAPLVTEALANARWSVDFVQDQFADGRHFRNRLAGRLTAPDLAACLIPKVPGGRLSDGFVRGPSGAHWSGNATE